HLLWLVLSLTTTVFPYTTLFRSSFFSVDGINFCPPKPGFTDISNTMSSLSITYSRQSVVVAGLSTRPALQPLLRISCRERSTCSDRKSTRLNSSHVKISYAVFCL